MSPSLLEQLPRYSAYDPGTGEEGGLDPLGTAAIADRLSDLLAPGLRARMSQPHFVTLSAIGALSCQSMQDKVGADRRTTPDIAFEWLVVESLARHADPLSTRGLPGIQKARRAVAMKERLSAKTYLVGPRVTGFTGVYRPFSRDAGALNSDGTPGLQADALILAWEADQDLPGFLEGSYGSVGLKLRHNIGKECAAALASGRLEAPITGWLMKQIAASMLPTGSGYWERQALRDLILSGEHEVRDELAHLMVAANLPTDATEPEWAAALLLNLDPPMGLVMSSV